MWKCLPAPAASALLHAASAFISYFLIATQVCLLCTLLPLYSASCWLSPPQFLVRPVGRASAFSLAFLFRGNFSHVVVDLPLTVAGWWCFNPPLLCVMDQALTHILALCYCAIAAKESSQIVGRIPLLQVEDCQQGSYLPFLHLSFPVEPAEPPHPSHPHFRGASNSHMLTQDKPEAVVAPILEVMHFY